VKKYFSKGDLSTHSRISVSSHPFFIFLKQFFSHFIKRGTMKTRCIFFISFLTLILIPFTIFAQDIEVHKLIGKSKSDVIKKYGNPVHQDNSNPAMVCMFYKSSTKNMIFVSNKDGVYQAEATASYNNEKDARSAIDDFISGSTSDGYAVDSVTTSDFHLQTTGVKVDLQISENKLSKKFDIRVKANRSIY
jgi:hypothetical protein